MARARPSRSAADYLPPRPTLTSLREAAAGCRGCDLYRYATQTVFGEGSSHPQVFFVGEQPGHEEDLAGRPFVGPAGRLLDEALAEVGIDRRRTYVTNAVKHFKFESKGKRRIHAKPSASEIAACNPWLQAEIELLKPRVIVCLGATAAQSLLGKQFRVSRERGVWVPSPLAPFVMATVHPSAILRAPDEEARRLERARFVEDLAKVAAVLTAAAA
jgi:uracil-DNA glycosylase